MEHYEIKTDIEKELFNIVSEILGVDEFGVNTDLFNIGLTSLSVIKLTSKEATLLSSKNFP